MLDAVIVSDIHLGSANCQVSRLTALLERIISGKLPTRRLILNGDVFDSFDFRRLRPGHWEVLALLRALSRRIECVWLVGNHEGCPHNLTHLLHVAVCEEYTLNSGPERILLLHGHRFDDFLRKHPFVTYLADCGYHFLQWLDPTHGLAKHAKHTSKTFIRCTLNIERGAVELARERGFTAVCTGHTHVPVGRPDQDILYFNSGCWTELPCTYLTVDAGVISLWEWAPTHVDSVPKVANLRRDHTLALESLVAESEAMPASPVSPPPEAEKRPKVLVPAV